MEEVPHVDFCVGTERKRAIPHFACERTPVSKPYFPPAFRCLCVPVERKHLEETFRLPKSGMSMQAFINCGIPHFQL